MNIKRIGKKSERVGKTTVSGEGTYVDKNGSDDAVAVRDYVSGRGYGGIVDWDGERVTVGGRSIEPLFVENGKAYVNRADADKAISLMGEDNGISGSMGAENKRREKYGEMEDKALSDFVNQKPFSYDHTTDPRFKAYKEQYERNAEYAMRRILNDNNTSITGATGAVLSDAMAAQYEELRKIADVIPTLYDDAYEAYRDESERLRDNVEGISDVADAYFQRLYNSHRDAYENIVNAGESERKEKQRWVDNERNEVYDTYENAIKDIDIKKGNTELLYYGDILESDIIKNAVSSEKTALSNAISRGFFIREDEAAMPWLKSYRVGDGYSVSPTLAEIALEYESAKARERGKIHAKLGM